MLEDIELWLFPCYLGYFFVKSVNRLVAVEQIGCEAIGRERRFVILGPRFSQILKQLIMFPIIRILHIFVMPKGRILHFRLRVRIKILRTRLHPSVLHLESLWIQLRILLIDELICAVGAEFFMFYMGLIPAMG